MLLEETSSFELFFIDLIYWLIIQGLVGFIAAHRPQKRFNPENWRYRTRKWEKDGRIYQDWFKIKHWKPVVWDAGRVFQRDFRKDHVDPANPGNLERWIIETCRAEWCHHITFWFILPLTAFNPPALTQFWLLYDMVLNLVPIVVQRYNRPRLKKLLTGLQRREKSSFQNTQSPVHS